MTENLDVPALIAQVRAHLDEAVGDHATVIEALARARTTLGRAQDEALAAAALDGVSVRALARSAGMAPNSVRPALARSTTLGAYADADAGVVDAVGLIRARIDAGDPAVTGTPPLRFTRRTRKDTP